jgi:hypothetical protein
MVRAEPALAHLFTLDDITEWMNGIQIYLTEDVPLAHGHTIYVDSPWALTSISQAQFWSQVDLFSLGDGGVRGIISVDISEWEQKGLNGKAAKECTAEEIKAEVWEQLKRSVNFGDVVVLKDEQVHSWSLDPDIRFRAEGASHNEEPLLVNLIDTWKLRPEAVTRIPNLFLASDYVRTHTDLATMEAANEAARRAVNGILDATGSGAPRCRVWELHEPELFAPWREIDRIRYAQGLPWDDGLVRFGLSLAELADQALAGLEGSSEQWNMFEPAGIGLPFETTSDLRRDAASVIERAVRVMALRMTTDQGSSRGVSVLTNPAGSGRVQILPK